MDRALQGQVSRSAADVYEEFFVPALFREPAQHVVRAADIRRGRSVLDLACGTGVLAREAVRATGNDGNVTGLDRNDGMLAVAKRLAPGINWQRGLAEALPFADRSFDRVFSQFALMFFDDDRNDEDCQRKRRKNRARLRGRGREEARRNDPDGGLQSEARHYGLKASETCRQLPETADSLGPRQGPDNLMADPRAPAV